MDAKRVAPTPSSQVGELIVPFKGHSLAAQDAQWALQKLWF